jgi:hypothetical protein
MEPDTTVWLVRPEAPLEAEDVEAMRRAIEEDSAREGSLASQCLDAARAHGLSGEETYLLLAYQALLRLEETQQRSLYISDLSSGGQAANGKRGIAARLWRLARRGD